MIAQYESVESLKKLVCGNRMPFIQKIYHLLSYSKYHSDDTNEIGIFWTSNQEIMMVNSSVLGKFIDIKPNSVNKNLKAYGLVKEKAPNTSLINLNKLFDRAKWIYRKSSIYSFNSNTSFDEVLNFRPYYNIHKSTFTSPPLEIHKNELICNIKISSMSLLKNRNSNWETTFKSKFAEHWFEIAESNNTVNINNIMQFLKNDQKEVFASNPGIELKIMDTLYFFSNNNNELIDIDDYFVFCSFFGFGGAIVQNIENCPLKVEGIEYDEAGLKNSWFKKIKCDQILLKLFENYPIDTWAFCFSSEPGIYLLLNKNESCIFQTQIFFDAIDNSYYIGTSLDSIKKFPCINDIVFTYLKFGLENYLNMEVVPNVISVPADYLHMSFQKKNDFYDAFPFDDDDDTAKTFNF